MNSLIEQLNEEYSNISHENEIITILNIVNDISLSFNIDIENKSRNNPPAIGCYEIN